MAAGSVAGAAGSPAGIGGIGGGAGAASGAGAAGVAGAAGLTGDSGVAGTGAAENDGPKDAYVPNDALRFEPPRGLFAAPTSLELSTDIPNGTIFYTLDGTEPSSTHGMQYDGAISVERTATVRAVVVVADTAATPVATHTYLLPAQVL
jgi:hypothetical protein